MRSPLENADASTIRDYRYPYEHLEEKNVIWRVGSVEDRTRFDANPERHHHFVCQSCGRVIDFHSDEMDALRAPHASSAIGKVDYVHVELRGTCAHCQARRAGKK